MVDIVYGSGTEPGLPPLELPSLGEAPAPTRIVISKPPEPVPLPQPRPMMLQPVDHEPDFVPPPPVAVTPVDYQPDFGDRPPAPTDWAAALGRAHDQRVAQNEQDATGYVMEPDIVAGMTGGPDLPPNVAINDAGIPFDVQTGQEVPVARRPGVLPVTRTPTGLEFALPKVADLAGLLQAAVVPENSLGIFGGRMAKTANLQKLQQAETMERQGADAAGIFDQTGWWRGPDNQWRFEINDQAAGFRSNRELAPEIQQRADVSMDRIRQINAELERNPAQPALVAERNRLSDELIHDTAVERGFGQAQDYLSHPELYEAYPSTRTLPTQIDNYGDEFRGSYEGPKGGIQLNTAKAGDTKKTMLHELQHHIQQVEGFTPGGNVSVPEVQEAIQGHDVFERRRLYREGKREIEKIRDEWVADWLKKILHGMRPPPTKQQLMRMAQDQGFRHTIEAREHFWAEHPLLYQEAMRLTAQARLIDKDYGKLLIDTYRRIAGEVEARNVERRSETSPIITRSVHPQLTEDIQRGEQIIRQPDRPGLTEPSLSGAEPHVTETPAFKRWFGDSKVVDTDGRPLVVYHGTDADDFHAFDRSEDIGFHFGTVDTANTRLSQMRPAEDPNVSWLDTRIIPTYLSIKKPLRLPDLRDWAPAKVVRALENAGVLSPKQAERALESNTLIDREFVRDALAKKGYDGIVYRNKVEGQGKDSWIAMRPEQIKSAYGNSGTFDPANPNVMRSMLDPVEESQMQRDGLARVETKLASQNRGEAFANPGLPDRGTAHEQGTTKTPAAAGEGNAPVQSGGASGAGSLEEAQRAAARAAGDAKPLEGLPDKPLVIDGKWFVPGPDARIHDIAADYMREAGLPYQPLTDYVPVDKLRARKIASAFEKMKHDPENPKVKAAYDAMIDETIAQYRAMEKAGVNIEFIKPGQADPYAASPRLAAEDLRNNNHLWVFPTDLGFGTEASIAESPMLRKTGIKIGDHELVANDVFRIVHDYFGHFKDGVGFRADGEENAWRSHSRMYSPLARKAMTTETRGQNSWLNYGPHGAKNRIAKSADTIYAEQKVGLLPDWAVTEGAGPGFEGPKTESGKRVINAGVTNPTHKVQTVADPHRMMFPGIYENPRIIARDAAARVAPEDPALKQLFGVTRGDLDEMAKGRVGNEAPNVPEPGPRARGALSAQNIQTPQNTQRIQDILTEGGRHPGLRHADAWYIMDPLYQQMERMWGPEEAKKRFLNFNTMVAMASPGSDVATEIARGTAAHQFAREGRFEDFARWAGVPEEFRTARSKFPAELAHVPGHPYHRTAQADPMRKYLETGSIQSENVKVPLYAQASQVPETGFQTAGPVGDAHFARGTGLSDTRKGPTDVQGSISRSEYQTLQPWWKDEIAKPLGLESVPAQARLWTVLGPRTGVDSALGAGKLELFARQIVKAAARLKVSPETARDMILSGKASAGMLGAGIVTPELVQYLKDKQASGGQDAGP